VALGFDVSDIDQVAKADVHNAIWSMANKLNMGNTREAVREPRNALLPTKIFFPYSRHSSYPELCDLVARFRPRDIWPCTAGHWEWHEDGT